MRCFLCSAEIKEASSSYKTWQLCGNCSWMVERMIGSMAHGKNLKIHWGNRSLAKNHWMELKAFLHIHQVTSVLEYGGGLSTELMLLDGYDVTVIESAGWYGRLCEKIFPKVIIGNDNLPTFKGRFDCAIVDGPQGKGHRWRMVDHALEYTDRFMYLHDPEMLQVKILVEAGWNPMQQWSMYKEFCRFWQPGT